MGKWSIRRGRSERDGVEKGDGDGKEVEKERDRKKKHGKELEGG